MSASHTSFVQVCEVHVQLSHCRASTVHSVSASLAPDGTRNHKLNGKNKTGKEVKASSNAACRPRVCCAYRYMLCGGTQHVRTCQYVAL